MKPMMIATIAGEAGSAAAVWTYIAYLLISVALTVWVARTLHKNGRIFLVDCILGNEALAGNRLQKAFPLLRADVRFGAGEEHGIGPLNKHRGGMLMNFWREAVNGRRAGSLARHPGGSSRRSTPTNPRATRWRGT